MESNQIVAVIPAKQAALSGVTLKDTDAEKPIRYDEAHDAILGIGEFSTITYTLPETLKDGNYDLYLELSKGASPFVCGSTPVTVSINGGRSSVSSVNIRGCAMSQAGLAPDSEPTYMDDMGLFAILRGVSLSAGGKVVIGGVAGNEFCYNGAYDSSMPAVGGLTVAVAGSAVEQGYADGKFTESAAQPDAADPLSGLEIAWLGSSVTYGQGAGGYSMADAIAEKHPATHCYKYAISGTTLASHSYSASLPTDGEGSHGSYVERVKQLDPEQHYDLFIIQLSTNDATNGIPMGTLSESKELADLDPSTVTGAMEYLVKYVSDTWDCPVMFYSGSRFDSEQYQEMVDVMLAIQKKWEIGVIDLWNNEAVNAIDDTLRAAYIKEDGIHPLKPGYAEWWAPVFETEIAAYLRNGNS